VVRGTFGASARCVDLRHRRRRRDAPTFALRERAHLVQLVAERVCTLMRRADHRDAAALNVWRMAAMMHHDRFLALSRPTLGQEPAALDPPIECFDEFCESDDVVLVDGAVMIGSSQDVFGEFELFGEIRVGIHAVPSSLSPGVPTTNFRKISVRATRIRVHV